MAVTMRTTSAFNSCARPSRRSVVVRAESGHGQQVQIAAATLFSAAAILAASPANAGVIVTQPQLKKSFYDETAQPLVREARKLKSAAGAAAESVSAPSLPSISLPSIKPPSFQSSEGGLDPRAVALPGALASIGGLAFAFSKLDPEFNEWFDTAAAKNSNDDGVGYEETIKGPTGPQVGGTAKKVAKKAAGTAKKTVSKAVSKAQGTGSTLPFKLPFGKN